MEQTMPSLEQQMQDTLGKGLRLDIQQRTKEWHTLRAQRITASEVSTYITPKTHKVSESASARGGLKKIAAARLIGEVEVANLDHKPHIARGQLLEPLARVELTKVLRDTGWGSTTVILEAGFMERGKYLGASPDGIALTGKGFAWVEIKCTTFLNYYDIAVDRVVPPDHMMQIQYGMYVSGISQAMYFVYHTAAEKPEPIVVECDAVYTKLFDQSLPLLEQKIDGYVADMRSYAKEDRLTATYKQSVDGQQSQKVDEK